ncbi:hypothetical protein RHGRI_009757 [Rhododendron griersonianum]|uniref:K Homology domain-containing protein n=1 Tax=Rhododendron griersonianum TaxID=479676 RepID=A0AAV6KGJ0_9ERIC|nr:hypothetical protein RHGRI_009757 [Rhododendron griersonianum]
MLKSIELETNARVKVGDLVAGSDDQVITIYCYVKKIDDLKIGDDFDDGKPPVWSAQDALMGVHSTIAAASKGFFKRMKYKHECRLLVPKSQIGRIIGKDGRTIQRLRTKIGTLIEVAPKDARRPVHPCALEVDHLVTITGNPEAVSRSLFIISAMMYKFPPKEHIPLDTNV